MTTTQQSGSGSENGPVIWVDADACPVKAEICKVGLRHQCRIVFVSNQWMRTEQHPLIRLEVVTGAFDAADDYIVENLTAGDLVITSDIPLADRALKKQASVMGPTGKAFTEDGIGMAMAMRDLKATLRETGEISGYNKAFDKKDRSMFLQAMEETMRKLKA